MHTISNIVAFYNNVAESNGTLPWHQKKNIQILIVEPNDLNRKNLRHLLESDDY